MVLRELERAYISGFLDGDGAIFVTPWKSRLNLRAGFANVDKKIIEFINGRLGQSIGSTVKIKERKKFSKKNCRVEYIINYKGQPVKVLASLLMESLKLKKDVAKLALNFPVSEVGISLSKLEKNLQTKIYYKMKILNHGRDPEIAFSEGLTEFQKAWTAGFFDADGSVSVLSYEYKGIRKFRLMVSIGNTNIAILEYIKQKFEDCVKVYRSDRIPKICTHKFDNKAEYNRKTGYQFYINGLMAKRFLKLILPYLMVKKEQAVVALAFPISERGSLGRTVREKNGQKLAYLQMAALNKTGVH